MARRLFVLASAASAAVLALALTASPAAAASGVSITNFAYAPTSLTVTAGTTVIWTNHDPLGHSVTSDTGLFDSSPNNCSPTQSSGCITASGGTFPFTFNTAGTFAYHCRVHSFMHGTIVVTAVTTTTAAPVTTVPPTTTPQTPGSSTSPTTAAPASGTQAVAATTATTSSNLATTGVTDLGRLAEVAAALALAGGLAIVAARRKRARS